MHLAILLMGLVLQTSPIANATAADTDSLVISEILASNGAGLADEDGDRSDWIEIHNRSQEVVDLNSWSLTDNDAIPAKWVFAGTTIDPDQYLVVFASGKDRRTAELFWDLTIDQGDEWKYVLGRSEPPEQWPDLNFDDSDWSSGPSGFGYGDDDDATVLLITPSAYFRKTFDVSDLAAVLQAVLHVDYDDGFVAYLNGIEIARSNIGAPGVRPEHDAAATTFIEPLMIRGLPPQAFFLPNVDSLLLPGDNVLAIQLHNSSIESSDLSLIPFLTLGYGAPREGARPVPELLLGSLGTNLHTNFKLDRGGEFLGLFDAAGAEVFAFDPEYPEQETDVSYGLSGNEPAFFALPTPGAPNGEPHAGFVEPPWFSVDHGFFESPFQVTIQKPAAGVEIRYTTNGSVPERETGELYQDPVEIFGTTVLRARAFQDGYQPSPTVTQSYVFLADVVDQSSHGRPPEGWPSSWGVNAVDYGMDPEIVGPNGSQARQDVIEALGSLPSISLVTDLGHLFDVETGIYANSQSRGREFERPVSVELLQPDGSVGFQIDAGLRIRGGWSRNRSNPKHAFRLLFRDKTLEYPLFGDEGLDEFVNLDLRTSQNYSWAYQGDERNIMNRDVFSRDMQRDLGDPYTRSRYYHLYLNGQYWGLFQSQERSEASYAAAYFGGNEEDFDVLKSTERYEGWYDIEATDGDLIAWNHLWNRINKLADEETQEAKLKILYEVQGLDAFGRRDMSMPVFLDVDNLIHFMLGIFYTGNLDSPLAMDGNNVNNFYSIRDRRGGSGFIHFQHDAEHTLLWIQENRTGPYPAGRTFKESNPQWIHQQLTTLDSYRLRFADIASRHLETTGTLGPEAGRIRFMDRAHELESAILAESARWGDSKVDYPYTVNHWQYQIDQIANQYLPSRSDIVLNQLKNAVRYRDWNYDGIHVPAPLLPALDPPQFDQTAGNVPTGTSVELTSDSPSIYYTVNGPDPRLPDGAVSDSALSWGETPILVNRRLEIQARSYSAGDWSVLARNEYIPDAEPADTARLALSEIMYYPPAPVPDEIAAGFDDANDFEFLELTNLTDQQVDLSGVTGTDGVSFALASGTLHPGAMGVLVRNEAAFRLRYGAEPQVLGVYTGRLNNDGETIEIVIGPDGATLEKISYESESLTSSRASGRGSSLVRVDDDTQDGLGWKPSRSFWGSPGTPDSDDVSAVVLNEIGTATDGVFVELHNVSEGPVDLSNWAVVNGQADATLIASATTLSPGEKVTVDLEISDERADFIARPWMLVAAGPDGVLTDVQDEVVPTFEINPALARIPDGTGLWQPTDVPSPGLSNPVPTTGPLVIREIMYVPLQDDRNLEYVVLENAGDSDLDMSEWRISGGISLSIPSGHHLPAGQSILLVSFDPLDEPDRLAVFDGAYGHVSGSNSLGPWIGRLGNSQDIVRLSQMQISSADTTWLLREQVQFNSRAPWPVVESKSGTAIRKREPLLFAGNPSNWEAISRRTNGPEPPERVTGIEISSIWPNPTSGVSQIMIASEEAIRLRLELYDVLGRLVQLHGVLRMEANNRHFEQIDLTDVSAGIYFLSVSGGAISETRTITVVR